MHRKDITQKELIALLDYNPESGEFTWKSRPIEDFATLNAASVWNSRFTGKKAGCYKKEAQGRLSVFGKTYWLSNLAWLYVYGVMPSSKLTHVNGDFKDNRISNLRELKSNRNAELTHEYLLSVFRYDPDSGLFMRKNSHYGSNGNMVSAGIFNKTSGYIVLTVFGRQYKAHRLAWFYVHGEWPQGEIDHINGDRSDNRIMNLRVATSLENKQNRGFDTRNTTGFMGVYRSGKKWRASIGYAKKRHDLGAFDTPEMAHDAYLTAKANMHKFNPIPRKSRI